MRPINIVLLVLAGAIGGAVVMRVAHRPEPRVAVVTPAETQAPVVTEPAPVVTPVAAPPEASVPPVDTQPAPPQVKPAKPVVRPTPVQEKRTSPFRRLPPAIASVRQPTPPPAPAPALAPERTVAEPAVAEPVAPPPAPAPEVIAPARPAVDNSNPPPPAPNTVTLNTGILIPVRLLDGLSTERNVPGDAFVATLDKELVADGFVIAERGARVEGRVVSVDKGSRTRGNAAIAVQLERLRTSDNQTVNIQTDSFEKRSEPNRTRDAEKVAGGAAIGAIIGAIAGGGKGAAIGAGAGGGVGAGDVLLTRQPATLPSETRISFRLRAPVALTERTQ